LFIIFVFVYFYFCLFLFYLIFNHRDTVKESIEQATRRVRIEEENVAGVRLPIFKSTAEGSGNNKQLIGLGKGGQAIQQSRESFVVALEGLIKLASLQTTFAAVDDALKITNRRVNALEYVVKPKLERTIAYISSEVPFRFFFDLKIFGKKYKLI
jgi:V-type H+-transporting ATPase subunit D